jgi:hypothetical protein
LEKQLRQPPHVSRRKPTRALAEATPSGARSVSRSGKIRGPVGSSGHQIAGKPPQDPADRLPASAREKYRQLVDTADEQHAALTRLSDVRNHHAVERSRLTSMLSKEEASVTRGRYFANEAGRVAALNDPRLIELREKHAREDSEFQRYEGRYREAEAKWNQFGGLRARIASWLKANHGPSSEFAGDIKPKRGATVESLRAEVVALKAEMEATRKAQLDPDAAKAIARQQIEELAASGKPDLRGLLHHGEPIKFPRQTAVKFDATAAHVFTSDGLALLGPR